ncbi:MAG TPA: T9SS type A sorting domain-containing protein [Saprospiraceae bacterium]|nr:T9SS type A sorting domain-containing protein [Saprospiraceae bacterium]
MKRFLPFTFLMLLALLTKSQISIGVEPATFVLSGNPSDKDVKFHVDVTNNSPFEVGILWTRVVNPDPNTVNWITWICDKNLCYLPIANASAPNKPNLLAPGEKMDFQIHVNPLGNEVNATYNIELVDYSDPNVILGKIQGEIKIDNTVSTSNTTPAANLTIFPNPTTDFFRVSEIPGLKNIELFNIVGNKVRSFEAVPQKQYYVGDLTDGIYLVRLESSNGKVIKTIRLSKR